MFLRAIPLRLPIALLLAALPAAAMAAPAQLWMFEKRGCPWCMRWTEDVAPAYPKTSEGAAAPLCRIDVGEELPADVTLASRVVFTPTFVLMQDGKELGRIEGYAGDTFFWPMLDALLAKRAEGFDAATPPPAEPGTSAGEDAPRCLAD